MRDYWLTQEILRGVGFAYIALSLIALALALWLPQRWWGKAVAVALVLGIFSILPRKAVQESQQQQVAANEFKLRYEKAKALFDERCKTAGEKIYRTVEGVVGIRLIDARGQYSVSNYDSRFWPYAGFPGESSGSEYIMEFLYYHHPATGNIGRQLGWTPGGVKGFPIVAVEINGKQRRFRLKNSSDYKNLVDPILNYADELPVSGDEPRYAVKYENIPDTDGRANWVAGGRVVVLDQNTNETLGEFIRYAFEPGFGDTSGGRSPWAFAYQCPKTNYGGRSGHIRAFVEKVIVPAHDGN